MAGGVRRHIVEITHLWGAADSGASAYMYVGFVEDGGERRGLGGWARVRDRLAAGPRSTSRPGRGECATRSIRAPVRERGRLSSRLVLAKDGGRDHAGRVRVPSSASWRPASRARWAAWVRDWTPSFPKMLATWRMAVLGLVPRRSAISRSRSPSIRRRRTSSSRAVRPARAGTTREPGAAWADPARGTGSDGWKDVASSRMSCSGAARPAAVAAVNVLSSSDAWRAATSASNRARSGSRWTYPIVSARPDAAPKNRADVSAWPVARASAPTPATASTRPFRRAEVHPGRDRLAKQGGRPVVIFRARPRASPGR